MDTAPWHEALDRKPYDFTDLGQWETDRLHLHVQTMLVEQESANWRRSEELERQIGHACFEIVRRKEDHERFQQQLGSPAITAAVLQGEAAC